MTRELRYYQKDAVDAVVKAWGKATLRPAVVMATGTGKTSVVSALVPLVPDVPGRARRVLILTPGITLVEQVADRVREDNPSLTVATLFDGKSRGVRVADVVVATVASAATTELGLFTAVFSDESHGASADGWMGVLDRARPVYQLGVTATMARTDKRGLGNVWDRVVYAYGTHRAVKDGVLVEPVCADVRSEEAELWGTRAGAARLVRIVGGRRRSIVFADSVAAARVQCAAFTAAGIPAGLVVGTTPTWEREDLFRRFAAGELRALCTVDALQQGFDMPCVDTVVLARRIGSPKVWVQIVGRGLRPFEDKLRCEVIDLAGSGWVELPTLAELNDEWEEKPVVAPATLTLAEAFAQAQKEMEAALAAALLPPPVQDEARPLPDLEFVTLLAEDEGA